MQSSSSLFSFADSFSNWYQPPFLSPLDLPFLLEPASVGPPGGIAYNSNRTVRDYPPNASGPTPNRRGSGREAQGVSCELRGEEHRGDDCKTEGDEHTAQFEGNVQAGAKANGGGGPGGDGDGHQQEARSAGQGTLHGDIGHRQETSRDISNDLDAYEGELEPVDFEDMAQGGALGGAAREELLECGHEGEGVD